MLVSHSHQFILVKTKKTAGSSIQSYLKEYCKDGIVEELFGSHRSAESIIDLVGRDVWDRYVKICPMRNPWDQMVSWYVWERREFSLYRKIQHFLQGKGWTQVARRVPFNEYVIMREEANKVNLNANKIFVDGELPDYLYVRYEHLNEDMQKLCDVIKVPFDESEFPHKKGGVRKKRTYQEFYNDRTKQIIAKAYSVEIEKFGYEF